VPARSPGWQSPPPSVYSNRNDGAPVY
jgi:hypothetical protein